ncbi:hypothetical protein J6590_002011 [Homalodisca vitripennis]|nr:hypothetical protein J6590_002011 [Homalodisca vitripennis]
MALQDGEGQVALMAGQGIEQAVAALQSGAGGTQVVVRNQLMNQHITPDDQMEEEEEVLLSSQPKAVPQQNDMQNCFGFDEDDDEEPEVKSKPDIHILQSAMR